MSVGLRINNIRTASIIIIGIRHDNVFKLYSNRDTIAINSHEKIATLRKLHLYHEQIPKQNGRKTTLRLIFYEQNH